MPTILMLVARIVGEQTDQSMTVQNCLDLTRACDAGMSVPRDVWQLIGQDEQRLLLREWARLRRLNDGKAVLYDSTVDRESAECDRTALEQ